MTPPTAIAMLDGSGTAATLPAATSESGGGL
jgi:hypothetical protein